MQRVPPRDAEDGTASCWGPLACSELARPVEAAGRDCGSGPNTFWTWPVIGPLLFENESSDARDHCANERTFLSYLRLSSYMAIVAVAIALSFHLKSQPSALELEMATPLGLVFWLLAVACLLLGFGNYLSTINKFSHRAAIVQTGWKTQSVFGLIALAIVATCVIMLVVAKLQPRD